MINLGFNCVRRTSLILNRKWIGFSKFDLVLSIKSFLPFLNLVFIIAYTIGLTQEFNHVRFEAAMWIRGSRQTGIKLITTEGKNRMTKIIQIVIEQSKSFISALFFRKFRQAGCGVGPRDTTTFLKYQRFSLTLTHPIGLPPHAPIAQKIADQRWLIANSVKNRYLCI